MSPSIADILAESSLVDTPRLPAKPRSLHPLDNLTVDEINATVRIVKSNRPNDHLWIKHCAVREPAKSVLVPYLEAERAGALLPPRPARETDILIFIIETRELVEVIVDLDLMKETSSCVVKEHHAPLDRDELNAARDLMVQAPEVKAAIAELELPEGTIVVPQVWPAGADDDKPSERKVFYTLYHRNPENNSPDSNHWGYPLPLVVWWDLWENKVTSITYCYTGAEEDGRRLRTGPKTNPTKGYKSAEFFPELRGGSTRDDLKPLHVNQPEGPSFTVDGQLIQWQKWRFRVSFNYREGPVLHDVTYDGRRLFYRISLSEMHVPYADPRPPLHLKQVFDFGDIGLGRSANSLENGCDCLGLMKYFDSSEVNSRGEGRVMKNVICCHEQDNGILWKHTNTPTGRAAVVRQRLLILQTIITVGNYDYIFAWQFDQVGGLHLDSRATGILSTSPIDPGKKSPFGTVVAPGVFGPSHQHFINLRIDPAIDGDNNTIVQEDVEACGLGPNDEYGVGFQIKQTPFKEAGYADANPLSGRVFKITNPNVINPISMSPVSYKLVPHPSQMRLAWRDGIIAKRAPFTQHHIWVTSYKDRELFAAGQYTNQSNGNAQGLEYFAGRRDNVDNTDIVLWHTFALTHIPRVEDFPVMPVETHMISLKPCNFFDANPALDVPLSNQAFNKSSTVDGALSPCCSTGNAVPGGNGM